MEGAKGVNPDCFQTALVYYFQILTNFWEVHRVKIDWIVEFTCIFAVQFV